MTVTSGGTNFSELAKRINEYTGHNWQFNFCWVQNCGPLNYTALFGWTPRTCLRPALYFEFLARKTSLEICDMCFIAFIDLQNIDIDTKIKIAEIGTYTADLWTVTWFLVAILNFTFLAGTVRVTSWFQLFFEISTLKNPLEQFFVLLSSFQMCTPRSHICPANGNGSYWQYRITVYMIDIAIIIYYGKTSVYNGVYMKMYILG